MSTPRPFRSALFACLLSTFAALPAQEPVETKPVETKPVGGEAKPTARAARPESPCFRFEFAGGTVEELCAQLASMGEASRGMNIVIDVESGKAIVPKFRVFDASLPQVLEAACTAASSPGKTLHLVEFSGRGSPIYNIIARQAAPSTTSSSSVDREATAVHSLGALLKDGTRSFGFAPETILSAIETATGEMPLRALRYHTDSRLLIARGTKENLSVVADVLRELEKDVRRQEQLRKASESQPGAGASKASSDQPKTGANKDEAETR